MTAGSPVTVNLTDPQKQLPWKVFSLLMCFSLLLLVRLRPRNIHSALLQRNFKERPLLFLPFQRVRLAAGFQVR
jgi:hypothetical protein